MVRALMAGWPLALSALCMILPPVLEGCGPRVASERATCGGDVCGLHFIYVANQVSNDINVYRMTTTPGQQTPVAGVPVQVGTAVATCASPRAVVFTPDGKYAYVPCDSGNVVSGYAINSTTGALTPTPGSPYSVTGATPFNIAIEKTGQFLYTANLGEASTNNVSGFSIDAATGTLSSIGDFSDASANGTQGIATEPTGQYVYTANKFGGAPSVYCITAGTGALSICSASPAAGNAPNNIAVDPNGQYAYVVNGNSNDVTAYAISPLTGALSSISGSPFAADTQPWSLGIDPRSRFVYVVNETSNDISGYAIGDGTGELTPIGGSPFSAGNQPVHVKVDPSGQFAYVANQADNDLGIYRIEASGALTLLTTVTAGTTPFGIGIR